MVYFIIYLFFEVMISSSIAGKVGGLSIFLEILLTALIGIMILKNFKFSLGESINKARAGQITQEEFIKTNAGKAFGAILLIIPGFFTDIIGVMLQFSFLVVILSRIFKFQKPMKNTTYSTNFGSTHFEYDANTYKHTNNTNYKRNSDEIIDVEVIDDNKSIKH